MPRFLLLLFTFSLFTGGLRGADNLESLVFETDWFAPGTGDFAKNNAALKFQWDAKKEKAVSKSPGKFLETPVPAIQALFADGQVRSYLLLIREDSKANLKKFTENRKRFEDALRKKLKSLAGGTLPEIALTKNTALNGQIDWVAGKTEYTLAWYSFTRPDQKKQEAEFCNLLLIARPALEALVFDPSFFELSGDTLVDSSLSGFQWTSTAKDSARSPNPRLFLDTEVPEAIARMTGGKVSSITVSIFNRGDANPSSDLTEAQFNELVNKTQAAIGKRVGTKNATRMDTSALTSTANVAKNEGMIWKTPAAHYRLEWSATKASQTKDKRFRAEFLRLTVTPASAAVAAPSKQWKASEHIKTNDAGDKYIADLPMVDQGQKGYCAVAVAERILRYYGLSIDQHEIAKLADTTAEGTDHDAMNATLRSISAKLKLRTRVLLDADRRFVKDLFGDYNKLAKKLKKRELPISPDWVNVVDTAILKESRNKDKSAVDRFERNITTNIDQGKPVIWCVILGLVQEQIELPQTRGAHMRAIIGYNSKTKEIIYTDTWGIGHEMKRMKLDDALSITFGLSVMEL